jgi:type VI secretion system (T6SS) baseplate-like injector VgrG
MDSNMDMKSLGFTGEFSRREDWNDAPSGAPDEVGGIQRYWGKYQGVVRNTIDPEMRCRLLVSVEDVWGPNMSSWALPCLPYAGLSLGMYVIPPIGANVWVEFLHGNPEIPIWTGFWFGSIVDAPKTPLMSTPGAPQMLVESLLKHAIVISDTPLPPLLPLGGILLRSGVSYVAVDAKGVRIVGTPAVAVNGAPTGDPATAALYIT